MAHKRSLRRSEDENDATDDAEEAGEAAAAGSTTATGATGATAATGSTSTTADIRTAVTESLTRGCFLFPASVKPQPISATPQPGTELVWKQYFCPNNP